MDQDYIYLFCDHSPAEEFVGRHDVKVQRVPIQAMTVRSLRTMVRSRGVGNRMFILDGKLHLMTPHETVYSHAVTQRQWTMMPTPADETPVWVLDFSTNGIYVWGYALTEEHANAAINVVLEN